MRKQKKVELYILVKLLLLLLLLPLLLVMWRIVFLGSGRSTQVGYVHTTHTQHEKRGDDGSRITFEYSSGCTNEIKRKEREMLLMIHATREGC